MTGAAEVFGWDIGGAHVKACRLRDGEVAEVHQWPCRLWLGLAELDAVLAQALARWPELHAATHAVTMTGEMTDAFANRQDGVARIAATLQPWLAPTGGPGGLRLYAGDAGWCSAGQVAGHWAAVASANWLATAGHAAQVLQAQALAGAADTSEGLLVDIGSTTTDLIAFRHGRVLTSARSDHARLASGELVYHGVVRTPLCSLARSVPWRGQTVNLMNEWFATTADLYRLTGQLVPAHDQQATADGATKTLEASRQRIARLIGLDAADASPAEWLALAEALRAEQLAVLRQQLSRVMQRHGLGRQAWVVSAGCGDFLLPALVPDARRIRPYAVGVAGLAADAAPEAAAWAQVGAPCVAVAALLHQALAGAAGAIAPSPDGAATPSAEVPA